MASWAFCTLLEFPGRVFKYVGSAQGMVEIDPNNPAFLGAITKDNYTAELSAQVWAVTWIAQQSANGNLNPVPTTIWYDSESAAQAVQAETSEIGGPGEPCEHSDFHGGLCPGRGRYRLAARQGSLWASME